MNRSCVHFPRLALLLILLIAFWLRLFQLDGSSLWSDEGNTWALIQRSTSQIAADAAADIHPPGYYWLLKGWTTWAGTSAAAMRLFSAFAGLLVVALLYPFATLAWPAKGEFVEHADSQPHTLSQRKNSPCREQTPQPVHAPRTTPTRPLISEPLLNDAQKPWLILLPALVAALNPLQIYYSQEARMYMLLTLVGALHFFALLRLMHVEQEAPKPFLKRWMVAALAFVASGAAGLWIHYSFPILLAGAGLAYLRHWWGWSLWGNRDREESGAEANPRMLTPRFSLTSRAGSIPLAACFFILIRFALLNLLILLLYLPWIRTAITQVLAWPKGGDADDWASGVASTLHLLLFGPLRNVTAPHWLWLAGASILPLLGALALYRLHNVAGRQPTGLAFTLLMWLVAPIAMMFGLGLFSEAFLKFLLVASPAWCLLVGAVPFIWFSQRWLAGPAGILCAAVAILVALQTLPGYYGDSQARDNYAGIARFISGHTSGHIADADVADASRQMVILNAPGQLDVWRYYDPGIPTVALPTERPADSERTVAQLDAAAENVDRAYAILWATDESDPTGIVEGWLNQRGFKGFDQWQGNIRFVTYSFATDLACQPLSQPSSFTSPETPIEIELTEQCQPQFPQRVMAGDVALLGLHWLPQTTVDQRYKVTVQLLDPRNQVIAQRDSEPGGGSLPTVDWQPGQTVIDNHGLEIPVGTPPGTYTLIVALYDEANPGARLVGESGDFLPIGELDVVRPVAPPPIELLPIDHLVNQPFGLGSSPVTLLGYDLYPKGFAHARETDINVGDLLHLTLYWQAPPILPADWADDLTFTLSLGDERLSAPLAGGTFPTGEWLGGDLIRGEFDLRYDGQSDELWLTIGDEDVRIGKIELR